MKTKIRFYWPNEYRSGKRSFENVSYTAGAEISCIPGILMDIAFKETHIGRIVYEMGPENYHPYWKDLRTGKILQYVPEENIGIIHAFAHPSIDVFIDNPNYLESDSLDIDESTVKIFHLKYFSIPSFMKLKENIYEEYNEDYPIASETVWKKISEESSTNLNERRIISL